MAAAAAAAPCWADLPTDLLTSIVQLLELPGALAFATVCASWRSAAAAAGVPHPGTPWLMSWEPQPHPAMGRSRSAVTCKFRHLLDADKAYSVTFPEGTFVTCCGASDGWLVVVDELCNLSLHNLFTSRTIPLPPVTDFPRVEAEHDDQGEIQRYRLKSRYRHSPDVTYGAHHLATFFYRKAVLSGSPSRGGGGDCIVTVVHYGGEWISYARAGDARWRVLVSTDYCNWGQDRHNGRMYAECAYHNGSIYAVTYKGGVHRWVLDDAGTPSKYAATALYCPRDAVLTRHLVAAPGGGLWQVSAVWQPARAAIPDGIRFTFRVVDDDDGADAGGGDEGEGSMQEHALFLGLNKSAFLPARSFPGVRPGVLYFSAPWMRQYAPEMLERVGDWGGARAYDLKTRTRTFERVFPGLLPESARLMDCPTEVWITPNLY